MMKHSNATGCSGICCLQTPGVGLDPTTVQGTVPAGEACYGFCEDLCADVDCPEVEGTEMGEECLLATALIADQVYRAGFCPDQALACGTLFPELVF